MGNLYRNAACHVQPGACLCGRGSGGICSEDVFDILGASDHDTFREINQNRRKSYPAMLKAVAALSPEQQGVLFDALKKIVRSGKDAILKPDDEK